MTSSQAEIHDRLDEVVRRNLQSEWRQPLHQPTVSVFQQLTKMPGFDPKRELILDSGCGTGVSTRLIAKKYPDSLVIGIDRSVNRLSRLGFDDFPAAHQNAYWVRAELSSFWRLALEYGWRPARHYLLYPNPWPKPGQLQRRWHAHPVFPTLLKLGGKLEVRCNWKIYADEFRQAIRLGCGDALIEFESSSTEAGWGGIETAFGNKYSQSGHTLYRVRVNLRDCRTD